MANAVRAGGVYAPGFCGAAGAPAFAAGTNAMQPLQHFLACKYQHFNQDGARCGRLREWLILDLMGQRIGFFRITRNGFQALEWQGGYARTAADRLLFADLLCLQSRSGGAPP